jgi:transcriptional regulator with XRE-family HTH domain
MNGSVFHMITKRKTQLTKSEEPQTFRGDRLKWAREQKHLSQEDLGTLIGMTAQQLSRYETGGSEPGSAILAKIAQALDCSTDYLLGLADDGEGGHRVGPKPLSPEHKLLIAEYDSGELDRLAHKLLSEHLKKQDAKRKGV